MLNNLDLTSFKATSLAVPSRTPETVFFHLVEELGEVSVNLNRPEKADESLAGELADVLNCTLDIGMRIPGVDISLPHIATSRSSKEIYMTLASTIGKLADALLESATVGCITELLEHITMCTLQIYVKEYGNDYTELQVQMDKKCAKWLKVATK